MPTTYRVVVVVQEVTDAGTVADIIAEWPSERTFETAGDAVTFGQRARREMERLKVSAKKGAR